MSILSGLKPGDITSAFEKKAQIRFRSGRERVGWYVLDNQKLFRIKIPRIHPDWSIGVKKDAQRRSQLDVEEFADFANCPMNGAAYERIIRKRLSL